MLAYHLDVQGEKEDATTVLSPSECVDNTSCLTPSSGRFVDVSFNPGVFVHGHNARDET